MASEDIRVDVCLETVFTDLPYEDRIRKIAEIGYRAVEFWHPEGTWNGATIDESQPKNAEAIREVCESTDTKVNGFVLNAWDGTYGGCPTRRGDRNRFLEQVHKTIDFAKKIDCHQAVVMTGLLQPHLGRNAMRSNVERAFQDALGIAAKSGFRLLLEPLNSKADHPGFYLDSVAEAIEITRSFHSDYFKLLYDIYHMQIMNGNVTETIRDNIDIIGHMHVAGIPGRAEPHECELNFPYIFSQALQAGYKGWFGLEYFPKEESHDSLKQQLAMVELPGSVE